MNEQFIKELARQGAKKPTYQPKQQMFFWSAVMVIYAIAIFLTLGIRPDLSQKIQDPFFRLELFLIFVTSVSAGYAASVLGLPDSNQKNSIKWIPIISLVLLCLVIVHQYFEWRDLVFSIFCSGNYKCAFSIVTFSIVPSLIFFVILYRGATIHSKLAGFMIGLCGGTFSYLILRLIHKTEDVTHLFLWHFIPVFLVTLISMIAAKLVMKRI